LPIKEYEDIHDLETEKKMSQKKKIRKENLPVKEDGSVDVTKLTLRDFLHFNQGKPMRTIEEEREQSTFTVPITSETTERTNLRSSISKSFEPISTSIADSNEEFIQEEEASRIAPQVMLVNGELVLDESSLVYTVGSDSTGFEQGELDIHSNSFLNQSTYEDGAHITSSSYSDREHTEKWTLKDTELFYRALSQYGCDFSLIEKVFPGRTRRQIKNKFKREERIHLLEINEALKKRIPIDVEAFKSQSARKKQEETKLYSRGTLSNLKAVSNDTTSSSSSSSLPITTTFEEGTTVSSFSSSELSNSNNNFTIPSSKSKEDNLEETYRNDPAQSGSTNTISPIGLKKHQMKQKKSKEKSTPNELKKPSSKKRQKHPEEDENFEIIGTYDIHGQLILTDPSVNAIECNPNLEKLNNSTI